MNNKSKLRGFFRKVRQEYHKKTFPSMTPLEYEGFYCGYLNKILEILKKFDKITTISGFYPIKNEPDCLFLLEKLLYLGYETYLPFVEKRDSPMIFRKYIGKNQNLIKDAFGTPCPNESSKSILCPDIVLAPLLAFDANLNRLGYGGGFYDRCLKGCFKEQKYVFL